MPASIFSETELARLASFSEEIPGDDLIRAFTLTGADRDLVAIRRGAANRLGIALQLCALRYLGFSMLRSRDLGAQRLYRLDAPPRKEGVAVLLKGLVRSKTLLDNWDELLRVAGSLKLGWVDRIAPDFEAPDWRKRERLVPSPPRSRAPRQDSDGN